MKTNPENSKTALEAIKSKLETLDDFSFESLHDSLMALVEEMGVKNGQVLYPLRVAVSGKSFTPGGGVELASILGKEETIKRIEKGIEKLS